MLRRQAEQQARQKNEDAKKQIEEQAARQAEQAKLQISEQARRDLEKERQRIADQAKRELDDARRQVAEARRQAEDAALQVEQAKKQAALDAQQQIEAARREQEQRERERQATLAALTPPAAPAPAPVVVPAMDPADIARLLQAHLKRVGCDPGTTDGAWTAPSQKALDNFNRNAGTKFDVKVASLDVLDAVRGRPDRVCPLVCAKGQKAEGDRCVQIVCDGNDVLGAQGVCRRRPDPPPQKPKAVSRQEPKAVSRHEPSPRGRARPSGGADSCGGSCEGD
ncbi:hypothetical protein [Bradyrhizobium sp. USDA 3650]